MDIHYLVWKSSSQYEYICFHVLNFMFPGITQANNEINLNLQSAILKSNVDTLSNGEEIIHKLLLES